MNEVAEVQLDRLRRMIDLCSKRHTRYRDSLEKHSIQAKSIRTLSDFTTFPTTSKQEFVSSPEEFRLEPDPQSPREYALADVAYTSGTTTGRPTPVYQTGSDLRAILFAQLRMAWIRGMNAGDRVVNLYPLAPYPHGGWIRPTQAAAVLGAPVVAATGGTQLGVYPVNRRLEEIAELVVGSDPHVVWGVPSYIARLYRRIVSDGGQTPNLRLIAVSGEPCTKKTRNGLADLAARAGAAGVSVSDSLGASELQFSMVECPDGGGFHNPAPELALLEAVDEFGRAVAEGEPGSLALTHLDRTGTVLFRYLVGDRVVLSNEPCPSCGWLGGRITQHLGREDEFVKVRGNLINAAAARAAVAETQGVADFRVTISEDGDMDVVTIKVAVEDQENTPVVVKRVEESFQTTTGVRPIVETTALSSLWDPNVNMKPQRFLDVRSSYTKGDAK